jgi:hypothetical protein
MEETMKPTAEQLVIAYALASAHGHLWSCEANGILVGTWLMGLRSEMPENWESLLRANALAAQQDGAPGGIPGPFVEQQGTIVHTTGTGRLTWEIRGNSIVRLVVRRPSRSIWADRFANAEEIADVRDLAEEMRTDISTALVILDVELDAGHGTVVVHQWQEDFVRADHAGALDLAARAVFRGAGWDEDEDGGHFLSKLRESGPPDLLELVVQNRMEIAKYEALYMEVAERIPPTT